MNGRRRITHLASALRLGSNHIDQAFRYFVLAVQHNFTQGRRTPNVVAACLYIVCRKNKSPHMLIDFSDVLQTNLFVLGNTFFRLCETLLINPPLVDPSLYIHRFAAAIGLGDEELEIASTALRLVQRMKRDWIQIGRRPAGVCGAALFIATRMHGKNVPSQIILHTVKVCDMTLRRRVSEFKNLPQAQLNWEDFKEMNPEIKPADVDSATWTDITSEDPPIFIHHRKEERIALQIRWEQITTERAKVRGMLWSEYMDSDNVERDEIEAQDKKSRAEEAEQARLAIAPPAATLKKRPIADPNDLTAAAQLGAKRRAELEKSKELGKKSGVTAEFDAGLTDLLTRSRNMNPDDDPDSSHGIGVDEQMTEAMKDVEAKNLHNLDSREVNTAPLAMDAPTAGNSTTALEIIADVGDNEVWDASDIPDSDVDQYINTPEQVALKEMLWTELNSDWIESEAEKKRIAEIEGAEGRVRKPRKPRNANGAAAPPEPKEASRKINWDAINAARLRRGAGGDPSMSMNNYATDPSLNFGDDEDEEAPFVPPVRPPPSQFLGSLRPSIPPPGSKPATQASQTQATQLYGMDDDDDDDLDLDEEEPAADEFTSHFKSSAADDDYEADAW